MPPTSDDNQDFEQTLAAVERSLESLRDRYAQVQTDQQRQQELQQHLQHTQEQFQRSRSQPLQAELKQIQKQLEDLEIALESQLFSWNGLKEAFWQAVRFGGIGVIIGWLLKSCAG